MAIIVRSPPRRGAAVLAAHVTDLIRENSVPHGMPMQMRHEDLAHSEPHPVYVATLDDLVAGRLLGAARQTSWRYLLVQGDVAIAEAELGVARRAAPGAKPKDPEFLGLTHGPFTGATVDALHAAEALPQSAKADYELRLLKVPAVYLVALWLHGANEDILIPMGTPPAGLRKNKPYSEAHVIRALRDVATRAKAFQDAYDEKQRKRRGRKS
jgi:hypothetical protein